MKLRSRIVCIITSLILVISLSSCSKDDNDIKVSDKLDNNDVTSIVSGSETKDNSNIDSNEQDDLTESNEVDTNTKDEQQNENQEELDLDSISNGNINNKDDSIDIGNILDGILQIKVIDCGQADSILLHSEDYNILVDAGEQKAATSIKKALDNFGVKKIDLLVATHPHADHIGGMQKIVEDYEIDTVMMYPTDHSTQTYQNLLLAIKNKGCNTIKAVPNNEYSYGDLIIRVLGPSKTDEDDLNNNSVVLLASFGEIDMLLTGDASMDEEKDYVENITDTVEILKVGHHGSDTATSDNLLDTIKPEVAVISCGEDNKFGHPTEEVLNKLSKRNIETLRTDILGDINITTNGIEYSIESSKSGDISLNNNSINTENNSNISDTQDISNNSDKSNSQDNSDTNEISDNVKVYITKAGKKYHSTETCLALVTSRTVTEVDISEATGNGLEKCNRCWKD